MTTEAADAAVNIHASTVAIGGRAVLIEGPSGAGKSDLALRLVDRGATLVADDRTDLRVADGRLLAAPPPRLAGLIEVRGLGIVDMPHVAGMPVALVVTLAAEPDRMPDPHRTRLLLGHAVPWRTLRPFDASTPVKVELALRAAAPAGAAA